MASKQRSSRSTEVTIVADLIWSWALTVVGATCFYLAGGLNGRKVWWAWYIGLFAQVLWATYALLDLEHRQGFLVGVALYGYVYVRNCVKWTREHRAEIANQPRDRWERWRLAPNPMSLRKNPEPPTVGPKGGAGDSGAAREE